MLAKDQDPVNISKTGVTLLNNALGVLPIIPVILVTGEYQRVPQALEALSGTGVFWVVASCLTGVCISYCGIWAQSMISATSFLVLVNVNKFVIIFVEVVMMGHYLAPAQLAGVVVAILSGVWYGKAKE